MKSKGYVLACLMFVFLCSGKLSADFIAIFVCDTLGSNIEIPVSKDLRNMRSFFRDVAKQTKLVYHEHIYTGDIAYPEVILGDLRGLSISSSDVVAFYFSGHGNHRESKLSPWPDLYFTLADQGVDYDHICDILMAKSPKFLLAIADACNSLVEDQYAAPIVTQFEMKGSSVRKNYQKLFLQQSGLIQITSSSVGEVSWALDRGGAYTLEFLKSFKAEVGKKRGASWETILSLAKRNTLKHDQTPYWETIP